MSFDVSGARVMVVGAGRSGVSAAELLISRGADVTVIDGAVVPASIRDRLTPLGVTIVEGGQDASAFDMADLVVLSPGVPPQLAALDAVRRRGVPVIGEVELASRWLAGRVVAITGTKGKSTTTTLAAQMLHQAGFHVTAGGNLGTPLSAQVAESTYETLHVVEVSSFQLETIESFHPWIAVLINLSPDHLDRHASFDEYARAKQRIFENQDASDWAIVNADDPVAADLARDARARRFDFALDRDLTEGVVARAGEVVVRRDGQTTSVVSTGSVRVPGRHVLADVLAATGIATLSGAPPDAIAAAVRGFAGLEHALEFVCTVQGVSFVNDSKATNIISVLRAIDSFDQPVVVILGGRYKGGDFGDLAGSLRARAVGAVLIGEAADRIAAAIGDVVPIARAAGMAEAVRHAFAMAAPGGVVLLAPGCSSFDMFTDYAARGRAFKDEARRLAGEVGHASRVT